MTLGEDTSELSNRMGSLEEREDGRGLWARKSKATAGTLSITTARDREKGNSTNERTKFLKPTPVRG